MQAEQKSFPLGLFGPSPKSIHTISGIGPYLFPLYFNLLTLFSKNTIGKTVCRDLYFGISVSIYLGSLQM